MCLFVCMCLCVRNSLQNYWTDWCEIRTQHPCWSVECLGQLFSLNFSVFLSICPRFVRKNTPKKPFVQLTPKLQKRFSWNSHTTSTLKLRVYWSTVFNFVCLFVSLFVLKNPQKIRFSNLLHNYWSDWPELWPLFFFPLYILCYLKNSQWQH